MCHIGSPASSTAKQSDLRDFFAFHLWSFLLKLISQHSIQQIRLEKDKGKAPHQRNGVEEVGVSRPNIDPNVVERRPQKSCIGQSCHFYEAVAEQWEDVSIEWYHGEKQRCVGDARIWFEDSKDTQHRRYHKQWLSPKTYR